MEKRWFAIEGARPHWCKDYSRRREIAARYPRMNEFLDVRQRWDPDRVFLNEFLENQIFQLPARDGASKRRAAPSEAYEAPRA